MTIIETCPSTRIAGVSIRTTHARAGQDIGALWGRAGAEGVLSPTSAPVAAYYGFDADGDSYTALVGVELASGQAVPEGWDVVEVPEQPCLIGSSAAEPQAVGAWWGALWQRWPDCAPRLMVVDLERWNGPMGSPAGVRFEIGVHPERISS